MSSISRTIITIVINKSNCHNFFLCDSVYSLMYLQQNHISIGQVRVFVVKFNPNGTQKLDQGNKYVKPKMSKPGIKKS